MVSVSVTLCVSNSGSYNSDDSPASLQCHIKKWTCSLWSWKTCLYIQPWSFSECFWCSLRPEFYIDFSQKTITVKIWKSQSTHLAYCSVTTSRFLWNSHTSICKSVCLKLWEQSNALSQWRSMVKTRDNAESKYTESTKKKFMEITNYTTVRLHTKVTISNYCYFSSDFVLFYMWG